MAESVRESTLRQALRFRNLDGISAKAMDTLTGGPFLAGLALALGASTLQIGLIAAIPFLSKVVFVPTVWLVERVRRRRRICLVSHALGRPLLVAVAAGALLLSPDRALWGLMGGLALYSVLATFAGLAWNAWMKDLLPARIRGRVFSRRLWLMGIAGMALSLGGALWVDWAGRTEAGTLAPLAWLFGVGAGIGVIGLVFLGRIPEFPTPAGERVPLRQTLARPFRDRKFRQLIWFSGSWAFATNLAIPFITVYMLSELGLSFQLVIAFSVASQLANLAFLNIWGRVSDRLGNRGVLSSPACCWTRAPGPKTRSADLQSGP